MGRPATSAQVDTAKSTVNMSHAIQRDDLIVIVRVLYPRPKPVVGQVISECDLYSQKDGLRRIQQQDSLSRTTDKTYWRADTRPDNSPNNKRGHEHDEASERMTYNYVDRSKAKAPVTYNRSHSSSGTREPPRHTVNELPEFTRKYPSHEDVYRAHHDPDNGLKIREEGRRGLDSMLHTTDGQNPETRRPVQYDIPRGCERDQQPSGLAVKEELHVSLIPTTESLTKRMSAGSIDGRLNSEQAKTSCSQETSLSQGSSLAGTSQVLHRGCNAIESVSPHTSTVRFREKQEHSKGSPAGARHVVETVEQYEDIANTNADRMKLSGVEGHDKSVYGNSESVHRIFSSDVDGLYKPITADTTPRVDDKEEFGTVTTASSDRGVTAKPTISEVEGSFSPAEVATINLQLPASNVQGHRSEGIDSPGIEQEMKPGGQGSTSSANNASCGDPVSKDNVGEHNETPAHNVNSATSDDSCQVESLPLPSTHLESANAETSPVGAYCSRPGPVPSYNQGVKLSQLGECDANTTAAPLSTGHITRTSGTERSLVRTKPDNYDVMHMDLTTAEDMSQEAKLSNKSGATNDESNSKLSAKSSSASMGGSLDTIVGIGDSLSDICKSKRAGTDDHRNLEESSGRIDRDRIQTVPDNGLRSTRSPSGRRKTVIDSGSESGGEVVELKPKRKAETDQIITDSNNAAQHSPRRRSDVVIVSSASDLDGSIKISGESQGNLKPAGGQISKAYRSQNRTDPFNGMQEPRTNGIEHTAPGKEDANDIVRHRNSVGGSTHLEGIEDADTKYSASRMYSDESITQSAMEEAFLALGCDSSSKEM